MIRYIKDVWNYWLSQLRVSPVYKYIPGHAKNMLKTDQKKRF